MILIEIEGRVHSNNFTELVYRITKLNTYFLLSPLYQGRVVEDSTLFKYGSSLF